MKTQRRHRRRDRGFSLLIVFMLIIVMVGAAATVILSTQQDLSVAGQDREALQSFYAAEYAVATAKDNLTAFNAAYWNSGTGWTPLLRAGVVQLCQPSGTPLLAPGTTPSANDPWLTFHNGGSGVNSNATTGPQVQYRWCVHNDPDDIAYTDPSVLGNGETPDGTDSYDTGHQLVIEGYGQVINGTASPLATGHVWVTVGGPQGVLAVPENCYSQEGGCGSHQGTGGQQETSLGVIGSGGVTTTVRGL